MASAAEHYKFAGWVTGSLHHNITGIFFPSLVYHTMICVQMRHECLTSQASLSCSPWKPACHDWTATDSTHNSRLGCECILGVTATWLFSVYGFCLCGMRRWKPHVWWFLEMKKLFKLLQQWWVARAGPMPWCGKSCDFTLLNIFWSNVAEHICIPPFGILLLERHWNWTSFETCYILGVCSA